MRKFTYLMLVLLCTMLAVPQSAGAQYKSYLYQQSYTGQSGQTATGWSGNNTTFTVVDKDAYSECVQITRDATHEGGGYTNFEGTTIDLTDVEKYYIEFDAGGNFLQLALLDGNSSTSWNRQSNYGFLNNAADNATNNLFFVQRPSQWDRDMKHYNVENATITITANVWYHYLFEIDVVNKQVKYTITADGKETQTATYSFSGTSAVCKGIFVRSNKGTNNDKAYIDNIKIYKLVDQLVVYEPTFTLKAVGTGDAKRTYTIINNHANGKLFYTTAVQTSDAAPAIGDAAYTETTAESVDVSVGEGGYLFAYGADAEYETTTSTVVSQEVEVSAPQLAAPSIVFKSVEKTGRYLSNAVFTVAVPDNSAVLLAPATEKMEYTFTPDGGTESERTEITDVAAFTYTPTAKGVLKVYASTTGYTESSYEMPMSNFYVKEYKSTDYSKATAEQINGWGFTTNAGEKLGSTAYNNSSWAATFEHFRNYPAYFVQNLGLYRSATQTTALQLRYFKKGNIEQFKYNTSVATDGEANVKDANVETGHIGYAHFFAFSGNGASNDYSPQNGRTGCYYMPAGNILMQHLTFRPGTEAETVFTPEAPAITLKAVDGANRIYTITNPNTEEDGRLYYVVSTATEAPAMGDAAYTMTTEASVDVTVTENSTIYAYCTDDLGTAATATAVQAQVVEVGAMTLSDPTVELKSFAKDAVDTEKYHAVVSVVSDNSALPVAPTVSYDVTFTPKNGTAAAATLAADDTYTFTEAGTLSVTATSAGYTSSQAVTITFDGSYTIARNVDFTELTKDNLTETEQANTISDWKSGNIYYNGWQLANPNSTLVDGLTFNGDLWQLIYVKSDTSQKTVGVGNRQNKSKSIDHKLRNGQVAQFTRNGSATPLFQLYTTGTEKTTIPEWSILVGYTVYSSNDVEAVAEMPTVTMTKVSGVNREYTITFDATAGEVLHYTMPGELNELTATESPKVITVTRDGDIEAWTTLGTSTSEKTTVAVTTGAVTLAEARITMKAIETVTEKYAANPTFVINKPNNDNVTLKPATETLEYTFTPADGTESERTAITADNFEFTPTEKGVLKVYATTEGYTTSVNSFPVSNYYTVGYESRDFSAITADELADLSGTYTKNADGTWFADSYRLTFSGNNLTFDRLYIGNTNTVDLVIGWGYGRTNNSYGFRARYAKKGNLFTLFWHTDKTGADKTAVESKTELETSGTGVIGDFTPYIYVPLQNTLFQLKDYEPAVAPVAQQPVVTMTKVDGANREYTITFQEDETLHYTLPGSTDEQTATESPVVVTVTESGQLKAWTTLGISTSDVVTVNVETGELQLSQPESKLVNIAYGFEKSYQVTFDNSVLNAPDVTLSYVFTPAEGEPEEAVTIADGDIITIKKKGTLVVTAETEGYTSNATTVNNSQAYEQRTVLADFAAMTAADFDSRWTAGTQSDGNWKFMQVTKYTLNDVADAATAIDGITLFSNKKPTVYLGYGLMAPHLDVDGMTASEYGDISINAPVSGEMAVYTFLHNKDKENATTSVQPVADVYHLLNYADILQRIAIYKPIADEDVVDGINTISADRLNDGYFYNLQGVRVEQPAKGVYIHNGKKIVIR